MPRSIARQILLAGAAVGKSDWFELTQFGQCSLTIRAAYSATTLVGTLFLRGTNNVPQDTTEPELITGVQLTKSIAGVTYTAANGAIVYASPTGSLASITIAYAQLPQFIQADWAYGSGGGTVVLAVNAAGWSVG